MITLHDTHMRSSYDPFIHRLRMLLVVPSLPPTTSTAVATRAHMIEDLKGYVEQVRMYNIRAPLQVDGRW